MQQKVVLKASSIVEYRNSDKTIFKYFGVDKAVDDIDEDAALAFKTYMLAEVGLSPCTVSRRLSCYRSMFRFGVKRKLLESNPFEDIPGGPDTNGNRFRFIERETIERVLGACKDDKAAFGIRLARYAGVRIPSEIRNMKYSDFGKDSFFVHEDTKTGRREVPFFPELRPHFERLKADRDGSEHIFSKRISAKGNLWRILKTLLLDAGIEPWPRLFNNLRASCVTEYDEMGFTEKTLDSIFGNTETIRKRHYVGFRKDRAFMQLLGTKNSVIGEMIAHGGNIETKNIDKLIRYLESLKASHVSFDAAKTGVDRK